MTEDKRYVVQAGLLGLDNSTTKYGKGIEYAIEVVLSDESLYTMYRSLKDILTFHNKLLRKFKVEAGYFKKEERVIPECPIKQSILGPQRAISDDKSFERLLNVYIKAIPALPGAVVKSDLVTDFFSLKDTDFGDKEEKKSKKKRRGKIEVHDDSLITGPVSLKSYYAVTSFEDKKAKFSFKEGATVQVIQKDPGGWWMVDAQGLIGWAPASYLVPLNEEDREEAENDNLMENENERVGTRYISIKSYQASRNDELSFVRGAVVKVLEKHLDGWWKVRYNGGEGMVPGALFTKFSCQRQATVYVKKIKRKYTRRGTVRIVPTVKPNWMTSRYDPRRIQAAKKNQEAEEGSDKKLNVEKVDAPGNSTSEISSEKIIRVCIGNYEGNGLEIKDGDKLEVLDDTADDWWFVIDSRGEKGWAPANYFQPIIDAPDDGGDDKDMDSMDDLDNESVDLEDCYTVIRDFAKSADDELDLKVGQMVCVIDDSDPDVWYVNMEGKEGWVPANVLEFLNEDDMTSSTETTPSGVRSGTVSADNSDLSDDGIQNGAKLRRPRKKNSQDEQFRSMPRPRSRVIHRSPSPQPPEIANRLLSPSSQLSPPSSTIDADSSRLRIKSIAEKMNQLEKEAEEADKVAREARRRAQLLRDELCMLVTL